MNFGPQASNDVFSRFPVHSTDPNQKRLPYASLFFQSIVASHATFLGSTCNFGAQAKKGLAGTVSADRRPQTAAATDSGTESGFRNRMAGALCALAFD